VIDSAHFFGNRWKLVGVVKDFNYQSLREDVKPLVLEYARRVRYALLVKFRHGKEKEVLAYLKNVWGKGSPDRELSCSLLQDTIDGLYSNEDRLFSALLSGSALAVLIALSSIFALSSFLVETKTKEIAIRKVLGASVAGIVQLLSKDFLKLIVIANFVAWPCAYLIMHHWMQNYAYRMSIDLFVFPFVGMLIVGLALITVLIQVLKAASANPVESLRYE
jgi:putative ABC transport system permease protein